MRSRASSLVAVVLLAGACTQLIGVNDYENVDDAGGSGGTSGASAGGANHGGSANGGSDKGGSTNGGAAQGGKLNTGGNANGGSAGAGAGEAGQPGSGGSGTGGTPEAGAGGVPTTGGTLNSGGEGNSPSTGGSGGAAGAPTCVDSADLLVNGYFDDATVEPWVEFATSGDTLITVDGDLPQGVNAQSGDHALWLGGADSTDHDVYNTLDQAISIPVGATEVTLRCRYLVQSDDASSANSDLAGIFLRTADADGEILETLAAFSNADDGSSWKALTVSYDVSSLQGQEIVLEFFSANDTTSPVTSFFFDNCSLKVTCE